jgi:hypothetical protein
MPTLSAFGTLSMRHCLIIGHKREIRPLARHTAACYCASMSPDAPEPTPGPTPDSPHVSPESPQTTQVVLEQPRPCSPREAARRLYESGLGAAQIAAIVGCPAGSVRAWAKRHSWARRDGVTLAAVTNPVTQRLTVTPQDDTTDPKTEEYQKLSESIADAPVHLSALQDGVGRLTRSIIERAETLVADADDLQALDRAERITSSLHRRLSPVGLCAPLEGHEAGPQTLRLGVVSRLTRLCGEK